MSYSANGISSLVETPTAFVSNPGVPPASRRNYLNFTTPHGVDMAAISQSGFSHLLIHESGYIPSLRHWNHAGVDSPFWRFYHNPEAGNHIRHAGREIPLLPDRVVLIPANTLFDCCGPAAPAHFWIHFSATRHARVTLDAPLVIPVDPILRSLLQEAMSLHQAADAPLRVQRLFHLSAALLNLTFARLEIRLASTLPDNLVELLALVERAPQGDLSNSDLAARLGMSVERFIRWFRQHMKVTPANYVINTRVRLAKQRLIFTQKTIEQIAAECGFPNRHYFSRMFAREVGCGPAEFRKRQQERKGR